MQTQQSNSATKPTKRLGQKITDKVKFVWKENKKLILFMVFVMTPVKSVLADWNWVPTGSMNPTILEGDMVYVNKAAYDLRVPLTMKRVAQWADPERGDIVVFFSPQDGTRIVKRVVGIPGDEVEMRNHALYLNGTKLDYEILANAKVDGLNPDLLGETIFATENLPDQPHSIMLTPRLTNQTKLNQISKTVVPAGHYFIIGDNRDNSLDSRTYGFVNRNLIVGKATHVICSFDIFDHYLPRLERFFSKL